MYEELGIAVDRFNRLTANLVELNAMQTATQGGAQASMSVDTVVGTVPIPGAAVNQALRQETTRVTNLLTALTAKLDAAVQAVK